MEKLFDKLPNSLRETLLQQARGQAACVYEFAIKIYGTAPFTIQQLMDKMSAFCLLMSRRQVDNGLSDMGLFVQDDSLRGDVGRPRQVFRARPLLVVLGDEGIQAGGVRDSLAAADLKNVPQYRMALHRALIVREQEKKTELRGRHLVRRGWAKFTRGWEAKRLGVDRNTIRRYDKRLGVEHMTDIQPSTLIYADDLPEKPQYWMWLVQAGKRFPAIKQVGEKLLSLGEVILEKQYANYYWIPT